MFTLGYSGFTRDARLGRGYRSPYAKTKQDFESIFDFRDGEVPFSMFPLGYFGHDASAALLSDGEVVACAAEERFTRVKYSLNLAGNTLLPRHAVEFCLKKAGITIRDVDIVAHYCDFTSKVIEKRMSLLKPFLPPDEAALVHRSYQDIYETMMDKRVVMEQFAVMTGASPKEFVPVRHHLAHAASAFYPSGFEEALILTIDGTGELESSLLTIGCGKTISEVDTCLLPTSLGALYLIITVYLGFKSLGDEYKVMGLASYGDPKRFRGVFENLVTLNGNGTYFTPLLARKELQEFLLRMLGPARKHDGPFEERHADIAAALQESVNIAVLHTLSHARRETGMSNLCLAGGVALNCTLNGVLARSGLFRDIFVQPAANDEGCSMGAALYASAGRRPHQIAASRRWDQVYWGPEYTAEEIVVALEGFRGAIQWVKDESIAQTIAREIARGKVAGWFQGRMEFGPRALGNRSILADPRDAGMKDKINEKVKRREAFRPFAPAVLEEDAREYFDMTGLATSPFMLFTVPVLEHKRELIPAVTHVDGTARVQTVSRNTNPLFWELIAAFKDITGVPVVLNTSYNVKNEPIVCSPKDALSCFLSTDIDCAAIGNFFVQKVGAV
ncbi:MAG: nodulation protein [Ignavibacteriales bacterium]|nr:nodulation protein [Ignavibacteriales bacterium]